MLLPSLCLLRCSALAHINPFSGEELGKYNPAIKAESSKCPGIGCGATLDAAQAKLDDDELAKATPFKRYQILLRHRRTHYGVNKRKRPTVILENRRRVRSALHLRTNAVGNTIACTFESISFTADPCPRRERMNAILRKHKVKSYRFRTKKPGKSARPRRPPQGPCARKFLTNAKMLGELHEVAFEAELAAQPQAALNTAAAHANDTLGAHVDEQQATARAARVRARARSSSPAPTAGEGSGRLVDEDERPPPTSAGGRFSSGAAGRAGGDGSSSGAAGGGPSAAQSSRALTLEELARELHRRGHKCIIDRKEPGQLYPRMLEKLVELTMTNAGEFGGEINEAEKREQIHGSCTVMLLDQPGDRRAARPLGFVAYRLNVNERGESRNYMYELQLVKEIRGMKEHSAGRALRAEAEAHAASAGSQILRLSVDSRNERAKSFHLAGGYKPLPPRQQPRKGTLEIWERLCAQPSSSTGGAGASSSDDESSAGEESGNEADGEEHAEGEDGANQMEYVPITVQPKGVESAVNCWTSLINYQAKVYEAFDDRNPSELDCHGEEGQALGRAWAENLNIHTEGNANWFYPHWSAVHYKKSIQDNGALVNGCDTPLETKHKAKRMQGKRVFTRGIRKKDESWTVKLLVPDRDLEGKLTGTNHVVTYNKKPNRADFEEIQRRESIASKLAAKQAPPAALTNLLLQEKKQAKTEERESGQQATKRTLAELLKGAGGSGDAGE